VVDVATLTGACIVALGNHFSGLMSNNEALAEELQSAGIRADDRAWRLPIGEEYVDQLKSNFADIANVADARAAPAPRLRSCGNSPRTCNGASRRGGYRLARGSQKGSTGRPVPLLVDFLINRVQAT